MAAAKKKKTTKAKKTKKPVKKAAAKKASAKKSSTKKAAVKKTAKKAPARKTKKAKPAARKAAPKKAAAKKAVKKTAKGRTKDVKGEGNYSASRRFRKKEEGFIKRMGNKIAEMGHDAKVALTGPEGKDLEKAEAETRARGEGMDNT